MTWKENLIKLYFYICEDREIQNYLRGLRMSNNDRPLFSDEEVMTIYLFGIIEQRSKVKQIYDFTKKYLPDWFPLLPSYQAYINRLNQLHSCFEILVSSVNLVGLEQLLFTSEKVADSVPIIVAGKSRSSSAKVAPHLCNKGYCSSKGMYYYGSKLHVLGIIRPAQMPMPQTSWISGAAENDLSEARALLEKLFNSKVYLDKAYADSLLDKDMQQRQNSKLLIPIKKEKGQKIVNAAADTYSCLVSKVRQPIESFFNWIIEKTQIQFAQKVRSENGLFVHIWGKFAAALLMLTNIVNP
jgi:hypothetical protein